MEQQPSSPEQNQGASSQTGVGLKAEGNPHYDRKNYRVAVAALVVAILSISIPFGFAYFQRSIKRLDVNILSKTHIVNKQDAVNGQEKSKISVYFDKKPVNDVEIVVLRLQNTGTLAVKSDDFEKPVKCVFQQGSSILSASVADTSSQSMDPKISFDAQTLTLKPLLMNAGDYVDLRIIVDGVTSTITTTGRIVDVRDINLSHDDNAAQKFVPVWFKWTSYLYITCLLVSIVGLIIVVINPSSKGRLQNISGLMLIYGVMGAVIFALPEAVWISVFSK